MLLARLRAPAARVFALPWPRLPAGMAPVRWRRGGSAGGNTDGDGGHLRADDGADMSVEDMMRIMEEVLADTKHRADTKQPEQTGSWFYLLLILFDLM